MIYGLSSRILMILKAVHQDDINQVISISVHVQATHETDNYMMFHHDNTLVLEMGYNIE